MSYMTTRAVKMNDNPEPSTSGIRPVLPGPPRILQMVTLPVRPVLPGPPRMVQMVTVPGRNYVMVNTPVYKMPYNPNVIKKSIEEVQPSEANRAPVDCENIINFNQPGQNNLLIQINAGTVNQIDLRTKTDHSQSINNNQYQSQRNPEDLPQNHKTTETDKDIILKKDDTEVQVVDINGNDMICDTLCSTNLSGSVQLDKDNDGELDIFDTIRNLKKKKQYKADYIACPLYYCNKYGPRCALDNHYILKHSEPAINDARIFDNFFYGIPLRESLQPLKESSRALKEPLSLKELLKKS